MQTKIFEKYFFFGLLISTFIFTFFILQPFWIVLVLGISFSVLLYPIYGWLTKHKLPNWLASLLTVIFFIVILCGPILGIGVLVFNQSQDLYFSVMNSNNAGPFLLSVQNNINKFLPYGVDINLSSKISEFISFVSNNIAQIFSTTLSVLFFLFLFLLSIFHFLKDGESWRKTLIRLSPLADSNDEKIMERFSRAINGVMLGVLLISMLQGVMMGIGLTLFSVPHPALWGVMAFFSALIPMMGTSLVSIPSIAFLFFTGHTNAALGLLVWAILMVSLIDNFLSPLFISKKINMPSLLILFSVLGGLSLFGPVGILIGPLVISLLYTLISIYRNEYRDSLK